MNNSHAARRWRLLSRSAAPIVAGVLLTLATLAHAQYAWVDDKGIKQFSDRPPPAGTPKKNVFKQPGGATDAAADADGAAPAHPASPDAAADAARTDAPPTLAERNADFAKRARSAAEHDKKAADEALRKAALKENCDMARRSKSALESGVRIKIVDKNGEPGYMSDAERAKSLARTRQIAGACD